MNSLFNNIIKHFDNKKDLGELSLKQGQRFDYMQNIISSRIVDKLPLIEQTSGNGLGSIIEPLTGKEKTDNESSLQLLNKSELHKLGELETKYENLIYKLQALNNYSSSPYTYETDATSYDDINVKKFLISEKGNPCPPGYNVLKNQDTCNLFLSNLKKDPTAHEGADVGTLNSYKLDVNFTKPNTEGGDSSWTSPRGCSVLVSSGNNDVPGAGNYCTVSKGAEPMKNEIINQVPCLDRAPECVGHTFDNFGGTGKCTSNYNKETKWPQFNMLPSKVKSSPNRHMVCVKKLNDDVLDEIKEVNAQINLSINNLTKQVKHTGKIHKHESDKLNTSRDDFSNSLDNLIKKKEELDRLFSGHQSSYTSLQNIKNNVNAAYLDYILWFICAATIGGAILYKLPSRS